MRSKVLKSTAVAVGVLGLVAMGTSTAGASAPAAGEVSDPIVTGLAGPLQFDVRPDGTILVAQNFSGQVTRVAPDGSQTTLTRRAGVDGIAQESRGLVDITTTLYDKRTGEAQRAVLQQVDPSGRVTTQANILGYERAHNPDSVNTYGFTDLSPDCQAQFPSGGGGEEGPGPDPYAGLLDSHPYAIGLLADGSRVIADAAGNDILKVTPGGDISTLAVIPPTPAVISDELANELGVPCVAGHAYNLEPVPTDVERRGNKLYISTLSGGPEDGSLGATGRVYQLDLTTGALTLIGKDLAGATNLAVAPDGSVYVAELFGGRVSKLVNGEPETVAELPLPAGLEYAHGQLYVSDNVFGPGEIRTISLGSTATLR